MVNLIARLWLGITLLVAASAALLLSDRPRSTDTKHIPRVAILQHASTPVLDAGIDGMIDGLKEKGFEDGKTVILRRFNAEGDITTANSIAQEIVTGGYDLVLTSSTPSMQAMASANRGGQVIQVFGLVADPYASGVGLERSNPMKHPRHFVGFGVLVPVKETVRMARKLNPSLQRVGMAWNPAESNSKVTMTMAREVCKELGLELLEASADNTSGVAEACDSLTARGAQVICVGGDNTVVSAIDVLIATARRKNVPVITSLPGNPERGTMLDIGSDFHRVGKLSGLLAGDILKGTDPATVPIRDAADVVPNIIQINLKMVKDPWRVPEDIRKQADILVDDNGVHRKQ